MKLENKNKNPTVSLIPWCLHLGRIFLFHPQVQNLRQSTRNRKLLKHDKYRQTKSKLISVKMETQAHRKRLEKNPDSRQSTERCLTGLPILWGRTNKNHDRTRNFMLTCSMGLCAHGSSGLGYNFF